MERYKSIYKESSLSRVWQHVTQHDSGTISGYRYARDCGTGQVYTTKEKKDRNAILKSKLLAKGYGVTSIDGVYIENYGTNNEIQVKEESFIVVDLKDKGTLKKDLIELGEEFEQDSITYSKPSGEYYLISSNTCSSGYPGKGKIGVEIKLGKPFFGKDGEFHSKINNRPFIFESVDNKFTTLLDYPPTEIRSIKAMSEEKIN